MSQLQIAALNAGQADTRRWPNAGLMLAHRLRRRANIKPALGQRFLLHVVLTSPSLYRHSDTTGLLSKVTEWTARGNIVRAVLEIT